MYYSQANQDEFVYNILNKQNSGFFVDIGCQQSIHWNNSYFLEVIGWSGICVDINLYDYSNRTCKYYNTDALEINYTRLFDETFTSNVIDYLSIDIDYESTNCLKKIPLDVYKFKVITIEHDSYRYGDELYSVQRDILSKHGYLLICKDIPCKPLKEDEFFEDWWVNPDFVDINLYSNLISDKMNCELIVKKFS